MKYSNSELKQIVLDLIDKGKEGDFWDFKEKWHEKIDDLIKDIICFSNTTHYKDCYLIFGVSDSFELKGISDDPNRRKQSDILDTLSRLHFANGNSPKIELRCIQLRDRDSGSIFDLDVLVIENVNYTPIYLDKMYGKMHVGCIYARTGDKNTPDGGNANYGEIRELWKKNFNLLRTDLDYVFEELANKDNWVKLDDIYHHRYRTELTIELKLDADDSEVSKNNATEFYSYTQCNEDSDFGQILIKAKGTVIFHVQLAVLDSGRLSIPVPEWEFVEDKNNVASSSIGFKYYIVDTLQYRLLSLLYDPTNPEQRYAYEKFEKVILIFDSQDEYDNFTYGVSCRFDYIHDLCSKSKEYDCKKSSFTSENEKNQRLTMLRVGSVLKKCLNVYREKRYF